MIVDIAITKGFGIEMAGTFVEDFTQKNTKDGMVNIKNVILLENVEPHGKVLIICVV